MNLMVRELPTTDELDIDVRRSFVVQDALREGRKKKFFPKRMLKVNALLQLPQWHHLTCILQLEVESYLYICHSSGNLCWGRSCRYWRAPESFFAFLLKKLATLCTLSMFFFALNTSGYRVDQSLLVSVQWTTILNGYRSITTRYLVTMLECPYYKEVQDFPSSIRMCICICAVTHGLKPQFSLNISLTVH